MLPGVIAEPSLFLNYISYIISKKLKKRLHDLESLLIY